MAFVYVKGKEIWFDARIPQSTNGRKFSQHFMTNSKKRKMHIGRRGGSVSRQRIFGECADCGKERKLVGFLCRNCYESRMKKYQYRNDAAYREKCLKRVRKRKKED